MHRLARGTLRIPPNVAHPAKRGEAARRGHSPPDVVPVARNRRFALTTAASRSQESFRNNSASCVTWSQCAGGSEATFCTIQDGLHLWPGQCRWQPRARATCGPWGPANRAVDYNMFVA